MNIAKLQSQLQSVPDQALIGYVQQPNGQVPAYLALAEITRRKQMRTGGASQPAPTQTVAEQEMASADPGIATLPVDPNMYTEQTMAQGGIVSFQGGGDPYYEKYQQYLRVLQDPSLDPATNSSAFQRMLPNATAAEQYDTARQIEAARMQSLPGPGFFTTTSPQERAAYETRDKLIRQFRQGKFDPRVQPEVQPKGKTDIVAPDVVTPVVEAPVSGAGGAGAVPPPAGNIPTAGEQGLRSIAPSEPRFTPIEPDTAAFDALMPQQQGLDEYRQEYLDALGTDPSRAKMQERLAAMEGRAAKEEDRAPWMALAEAGLGMAAGNSPFALQNIALGGMQGVKSLQAAKERAAEAEEKRFALESKLAEAQRAEDIAALNYGTDSKRYEKESSLRVGLEKESAKARAKETNANLRMQEKEIALRARGIDKQIASAERTAEKQILSMENTAAKDRLTLQFKGLSDTASTLQKQLDVLYEAQLEARNASDTDALARVNTRINSAESQLQATLNKLNTFTGSPQFGKMTVISANN